MDAPVVKVDEIKFELDDLRAHLAVLAEAGHFVQINAGAAVRLGKVELDIQGVETQAMLEARLHNVTAILARVLTTLDRNPELLESVGEALGDVGGGAHDLLGDTGRRGQERREGRRERGPGRRPGRRARESPGSAGAPSRASKASARAPSRASRASARAPSRASRAWGRAPSRASRASVRALSRGFRTCGQPAAARQNGG